MLKGGAMAEEQELFAGILMEDALLKQYNIESLATLESLALVIDTSEHTMANISEKLQRLQFLQLDGSRIQSVRDLGTGLTHLTYLSMSDCNLSEIDGIGVLSSLRELHIANNCIDDLTPLAMHASLAVVNAKNNSILDVSALEMLSTCDRLRALDLRGNPISRVSNFTTLMAQLIPHLALLNGNPLDKSSTSRASNATHQAVMQRAMEEIELHREDMEEEQRMEALLLQEPASQRGDAVTTGHARATTTTSSSTVQRTGKHSDSFGFSHNDGSELTHGSTVVLAGNMSLAMRRRRAEMAQAGRTANACPSASTSEERSETSLLKEIDDALEQVNNGLNVDTRGSEWVREGDITSTVLPMTPHSTGPPSLVRRRSSRPSSPPELRPTSAFARQTSNRRPSSTDRSTDSRPSTASSSQCNSETGTRPRSKYSYFSIDSSASAPFMVSISKEHLEQIRMLQKTVQRGVSDSESEDSDNTEEEEDIAITHRDRREYSRQLQQASSSPRLMRNHPRLWQEMTARCQLQPDNERPTASKSTNQLPSPRWAKRTFQSSVVMLADRDNNNDDNTDDNDYYGDYERSSSSAQVSRALGFDLKDSLAAIDEWIAQTSESDDSISRVASPPLQSSCDPDMTHRPAGTRQSKTVEQKAMLPPASAASPTRSPLARPRQPPPTASALVSKSQAYWANKHGEDEISHSAGLSALMQSDSQLVSMLRHLPKELRSKDAMRSFFTGVSEERMQSILNQAFNKTPSGADRVQKYMALLDGVLV